jgi:excisionase family DNA binding protein
VGNVGTETDAIPLSLISRLSHAPRLLTVKELSELLRVSKRAVYNAIEKDGLPVIRVGGAMRVDPVNAAKWLRARQVK